MSMRQIVRQIVPQPFSTFVVTVGNAPTPISTQFTKQDLIDSFTISLDAAAANNVFIGDQGVTVNSGLEIVAGGGPVTFVIRNQVQHYDVQQPLMDLTDTMQCRENVPYSIPFIVWDFQQIYLVAVANTNVRIAPWRAQFI